MTPRQLTRTGIVLLTLSLWAALAPAQANKQPERAELKRTVLSTSAVRPGDKAMLAVEVEIKEGFHAQSNTPSQGLRPYKLTLDEHEALTFGEAVYPKGKVEEYPGLGKLNVYTGTVVVRVPVEVKPDAKPGDLRVTGKVSYQICDDRVCYRPESPKFEIKSSVVPAGTQVKPNEPELFKTADEKAPADDKKDAENREPEKEKQTASTGPADSALTPPALPPVPPTNAPTAGAAAPDAQAVAPAGGSASAAPPIVVETESAGWGLPTALGAAFLAGILFNIVPCVLPVLPIKVLGFAEVAEHDRGKTLLLSGVFGLGIVSVFAVLAVLILVLKTITWGEQFANPVFAWGMVILLLVMSLWLFGVLNVNLPPAAYAVTPRHDTLAGNYLWGILTAVLSTPCTGPLFVPVMGWAATQTQAVGVSVMMMVGVGMAFPYVVLSAFPEAARRFPRVGPWSELFKQMLGFVLLAFTVFFAAGRLTAGAEKWWAVVPVALTAALYLMARTVQLSKDARPVAASSLISVGMVTAAILVAVRFTGGLFDAAPGAQAGAASPSATSVAWVPYSDDALAGARRAGKPVLVKFTANWCLNCQYVEATVFHDADAVAALRAHEVVTIKADLSDDDAAGWPLLRQLSATGGIPLTAIYVPGYEQPVQISAVYTTGTLVKTLDQIDGATKAAVAAR